MFVYLKAMQKDRFFLPTMTYFEKKKSLDPNLVKPNLSLLEQSSVSAWILDLEYKKKYIFELPRPTANKTRPLILYI
jgi:hypothetical protein